MDIVERLRDEESMYDADDVDLHLDAVDEIERLRSIVKAYAREIERLRKQNAVLETELALVRAMLPNVKAYQTGTGDFTPLKESK